MSCRCTMIRQRSAYTTFNWTQLISHATRAYMPTADASLCRHRAYEHLYVSVDHKMPLLLLTQSLCDVKLRLLTTCFYPHEISIGTTFGDLG